MAEQLAELNKGELEVYSTDEKVCGVWIDGRPIYRRTFVGTLNPSGGVTNVSLLSNVGGSDILSMQLAVSKIVGTVEFALTTFAGGNVGAGDFLFPIYYVTNGLQIQTGNTDYRGANYRLVVEYTKTV